PVTLEGAGSGNLRAELPRGSDIDEIDLLVDEEGRIIAEVIEIIEDDSSAFMTVLLRMPVNVFEIQTVSI
ncbi:MAG: hypothetical protein MRY49_01975, partial [Candidatus Pacebacteria bacterium]|nr:hypothetical protein [Candidatus Paceibacterota bacterium]